MRISINYFLPCSFVLFSQLSLANNPIREPLFAGHYATNSPTIIHAVGTRFHAWGFEQAQERVAVMLRIRQTEAFAIYALAYEEIAPRFRAEEPELELYPTILNLDPANQFEGHAALDALAYLIADPGLRQRENIDFVRRLRREGQFKETFYRILRHFGYTVAYHGLGNELADFVILAENGEEIAIPNTEFNRLHPYLLTMLQQGERVQLDTVEPLRELEGQQRNTLLPRPTHQYLSLYIWTPAIIAVVLSYLVWLNIYGSH